MPRRIESGAGSFLKMRQAECRHWRRNAQARVAAEIADRHKPEAPGGVCRAPSGVAGFAEAADGAAVP
jgi:hypothetical protein